MIDVIIFLRKEQIEQIFDEVKFSEIAHKSQQKLSEVFKTEMELESITAPCDIKKEDRYSMKFKSK